MSTIAPRPFLILLILTASLALVTCGSGNGTKVCPLAAGCCPGIIACPIGPQHLYADGLNGQIAAFPVASNGALSSPTVTMGGPPMSLGMAALNNLFLYAANVQLTVGGASSIDAWSIDPATGALMPLAGSPFSLGQLSVAGGLVANSSAQILYVGDAGKVDALKADATGALTPVPGSPSPSGTNIYLTVDPQNRFLFTSDADPPGGVFAFTIDSSTGALTAVPGSPFPAIPNSTASSQPGQITVDSAGKFVFLTLTDSNQVAVFSIVAPGGALTPVPGSPFPAGSTPLALTTTGKFLYVSNAGSGTLSGYSIDPTSGVLTALAGSPFAIHAAALTIDPSGHFLYGAGAGMQAFSIDSTSGALTPIGLPLGFTGATALTFVQ